jgi:segregation and condensation protein A
MMEEINVVIAGEFLVISSTLILIKSKMLLPAEEIEEEEEELVDPRQELVEKLLEHEKFKNASQMLYSKETVELSVWGKGDDEFAEEEKELISAKTFDLIQAFHNMVERFKEQIVLEMRPEKVTLKDKLKEIRKLLSAQGPFYFSDFFDEKISKRHLVVTFIALLELVRLHEIRLSQKGVYEDIRIVSC